VNSINPFVQQSVDWLEWLHWLLQSNPALGWVLVLAIGLISGSFIGCLVYRLPRILLEEWKWQAEALLKDDTLETEQTPGRRRELTLWRPPSHCPACAHPVGIVGLIPLLGYALCHGRCRHCKERISLRYPVLELTCVALAAWCYAWFGLSWLGLVVWLFSLAALALAWMDAESTLLPDQLLVPLLWLGLVVNYFALLAPFASSFWGCMGAYLFFALVAWLARLLLEREALGWGDVKLFAALAAWLGWEVLPMLLLIATLSAILYMLLRQRLAGISLRNPMPFGPFLLGAGWLVMQALLLSGFPL